MMAETVFVPLLFDLSPWNQIRIAKQAGLIKWINCMMLRLRVRRTPSPRFFVSCQHDIRVWKHFGRLRGRGVSVAVSRAKKERGEREQIHQENREGGEACCCCASTVRIASGYCENVQGFCVMRQFKAWWRWLSWHLQASNASMMLTGSLDS